MIDRNPMLTGLLLAMVVINPGQAQCPKGKAAYDQGRRISAHYPREICPQACLEQKRYFYRQAVDACPEEARYHNDLANVHEKLGQYELAIEHYRDATELAPHLAIPYFGLGDVHFHRQEYAEAIAAYEQGLKLDPYDKLATDFMQEAKARLEGKADETFPSKVGEEIESFIKLMNAGSGMPESKPATEIRLALHVHFETDRDDLTPAARNELDRLADQIRLILQQQPSTRFLIEGHTDIRGGDAHNQTLSLGRARTVAETLTGAHGIPGDTFGVQGYGESRPLRTVAEEANDAAHAINRRVEIVRLDRPKLEALVEQRQADPLDAKALPQLPEFGVSVGVLYQNIGGPIHPVRGPDDPLPPLLPGQGYQLYFRPEQKSYVYIFQVTGDNKSTLLWPRNGSAEVAANTLNWLPEGRSDDWLAPPADQDQSATLYLVASRQPREDIADLLRRVGGEESGAMGLSAPPIERYRPLQTMGVKRVRSDRHSPASGASADLDGVQVTRWVQEGTDFAWRWRMR